MSVVLFRCACGKMALRGDVCCEDCLATDSNLSVVSNELLPVSKVPKGVMCVFCQRANDDDFAQPMYRHADRLTVYWAHQGCEADRAYDELKSREVLSEEWDERPGWAP